MLFIGYVSGTELDLMVKATNDDVIEYYFTLDELRHECGEDAEYSIIYIDGVEILLDDLHIMRFDNIQDN